MSANKRNKSTSEYLDFKEIKANASVVVILESLDLMGDLTQKGDELVGRCMLGDELHGKEDSFSFNIEKKVYKCFACKARGSVLDFVKHIKKYGGLRESARYVHEVMAKEGQGKQVNPAPDESADDHEQSSAISDEANKDEPLEQGTEKGNKDTNDEDKIITQALNILRSRVGDGREFTNPEDASDLFILELARHEQEVFTVLFLDSSHQYLSFEIMFYGTVNASSVHPREIVKKALALNACAVICGHNHLSGVLEPSSADCEITNRLKDALALIDVRLLDHIIVGAGKANSMASHGFI